MALPLLIPLIAAGVSAVGSLAGGLSASSKQRKANADLERRRNEARLRFQQESNTDYLDTATARSAINVLRKQGDRQLDRLNTDAVRRGASDEAKVAAASRINENQADAISRLAGFGTQYQQQIKDRYYQDVERLDDAMYNAKLSEAQTTAGMIDAIGGAANSLLGAFATGKRAVPGYLPKSTLENAKSTLGASRVNVLRPKNPLTGR